MIRRQTIRRPRSRWEPRSSPTSAESPRQDYFTGLFETALETGELITQVSFPIPQKAAYMKFPNPASRYALVGVFVAKTADGVRVAVTGAGSNGVFRANAFEAALNANFSPAALDGVSVPASGLNSDLHADADYRAHLIGVMARRAVAAGVENDPRIGLSAPRQVGTQAELRNRKPGRHLQSSRRPLLRQSNYFVEFLMEEAVSAADANRKFSLLLRGVREGRRYVVTSHGKPVARLIPARKTASTRRRRSARARRCCRAWKSSPS